MSRIEEHAVPTPPGYKHNTKRHISLKDRKNSQEDGREGNTNYDIDK